MLQDSVLLGILFVILAFVFYTSEGSSAAWKSLYQYIPPTLVCYFVPSLLNSFGWVNQQNSQLYGVVSKVLLPACLVLFTLSVDFRAVGKLGSKALLLFATSALSVMIGGPIAVWLVLMVSPETVGGQGADAAWRGLATLAGTWIGGGANQTALREVFQPSDRLFSAILTVDTFTSNIWLAILLYGAGVSKRIDRFLKADASAIDDVQRRIEHQQAAQTRVPSVPELIYICAVGFGATAVAHFLADHIAPYIGQHSPLLSKFSLNAPFFWVVSIATGIGIGLSFTKVRNLDGAGGSKIATVFLYLMITTIGLKMDVLAIFDNPGLIAVGFLWLFVHAALMLMVSWLTKSPFFFLAVGSQACIGGPATAPVIAAAFHPALAPVGVILAILGYAVGTYLGYLCGIFMQMVVAP